MAGFEDLQQLWQQQDQHCFPRRDAAALTDAFRRYGRRNDLIGLAKILVIATQLCFIVSVFRHRPVTMFGMCLLDFSALYFMIWDWRNQRAIARLDFASPSMKFVEGAIAQLMAQRNPFSSRQFLTALAGFWTGGIVIVAGQWHRFQRPWIYALVVLGMPFLGFAFGRWIRRVRFRKECQPLIDRLEKVLATMQESTDSKL
ncbi:MAG: hypothetical protein ABI759_10380 [Candidatus Solibacter sp.]